MSMLISIKQFMEQRRGHGGAEQQILEGSLAAGRLLLDAIATHTVRGREADYKLFEGVLKQLQRRMNEAPDAMNLLGIASEAVEAMESHARRTTSYLREQNEQMQSFVGMLTDTLADVSGQADASVARLQAIEHQIEQATELEDMRMLSISLETCLSALREAATQHRKASAATVNRLQGHITDTRKKIIPDPPPVSLSAEIDLVPETAGDDAELVPTAYVAAFKLRRADHITARFGETVKHQMLALVSQSLKTALGPNDRLLRWKGQSFVMFLSSTAALTEIRTHLAEAVARTGQHYIEVGKKSALISVGVDWIVFPQAQCASLDAVFTEVDAFLAAEKPEIRTIAI
jgi:Diguanylate cyclase, GGDEF domain